MVLDIESYPEFVPWCLNGKVQKIEEKNNKIEMIADLTIGKGFFKDTYKSLVIYNKSQDSIAVTNLDGPLEYLKNNWSFKELGNQSEVSFSVDFKLKNKFLNILMKKFFEAGFNKITDAFEKRALNLFNRN